MIALIMVFSLCACGSYKNASTAYTTSSSVPMAVSNEYSSYSGLSGYAAYDGELYEEMAIPEPAEAAGSESATSGAPEVNPDKIIYSSDVTVETTDFDKTIEGISALIGDYKGYIESSSINNAPYSSISSGSTYSRNASYVMRVPSGSFYDLMSSLSSLGNIPSSRIYTDNVSSQYYDTQARLSNKQAQEQRLVELLEKAQNVTEIMEIESELADVRYEIESLQTILKSWDNQVAYSTVYLSVKEVYEYTPAQKITFGQQLGRALSNGFEALKDFVLWLVEALPVLIIVALIIFGLVKLFISIFRKSGKKRKAKGRKGEAKDTEKETDEKQSDEKQD